MLNLAFFCSFLKWISLGTWLLPCSEIPRPSDSMAHTEITEFQMSVATISVPSYGEELPSSPEAMVNCCPHELPAL